MCNACGFACCACDAFEECGCDDCEEPKCWTVCNPALGIHSDYCDCRGDDYDDDDDPDLDQANH